LLAVLELEWYILQLKFQALVLASCVLAATLFFVFEIRFGEILDLALNVPVVIWMCHYNSVL